MREMIKGDITIKVHSEFTNFPWGRYSDVHGIYSGETFRERLLKPALLENDHLTIDFENTFGVGSSFLDEAFAGLAYEKKWNLEEFHKHLTIVSEVIPSNISLTNKYVTRAYQLVLDGLPWPDHR